MEVEENYQKNRAALDGNVIHCPGSVLGLRAYELSHAQVQAIHTNLTPADIHPVPINLSPPVFFVLVIMLSSVEWRRCEAQRLKALH